MPKKKENEIRVVNIRLVKEPSLYSDKPINNPDDVLEAVAGELKEYDREVFAIINLRTNGKPINLNICSVGTLDSAMVSPREVFKSAILSNAKCIIAVHNHPSGTADPSPEDITTTERLAECGRVLDIQLLDHIIVSAETGAMTSMRSRGLIPEERTSRSPASRDR